MPESFDISSKDRPQRKTLWARILASKFLVGSIVAHLLFGLVATCFIVQRYSEKRKVTFAGGPPTNNASTRALEHKISMTQKKKTGGAPPQAKRIATAGLGGLTLPDMPSMTTANTVVPGMAAGMGGAGMGMGAGFGNGMGAGMGGGGGGGSGMTMFGFRGARGGLIGHFYDMKQTSSRGSTHLTLEMDVNAGEKVWLEEIEHFLKSGWNEQLLSKYFRSPSALSAKQFCIPNVVSELAPEAFGVQKEAKGGYWVALYKGRVSPPESGTYHFVGGGDAVLLVRVNGNVVLDGTWGDYRPRYHFNDHWKSAGSYDYHYPPNIPIPDGFRKGQGVELLAGMFYDMEVLIGDQWGQCNFHLLVERDGVQYEKTPNGLPILPPFRTGMEPMPPGTLPTIQSNGPVWKVKESPGVF